ncbi:hypothetical protein [Streptomyces chartreusis]
MRRRQKTTVSLERRQLTQEITGAVVVTFIQVTLTVILNALAAAAAAWAK